MDIDERAPGNISQQGVGGKTDNETGHDPQRNESEVPLPPDDEAPVEEELFDVNANNNVSSEHPQAGSNGRVDDPDADQQMNDQDENPKEPRGVPASDPESGA